MKINLAAAMDWGRVHYDRVICGVAALGFLASLVLMVVGMLNARPPIHDPPRGSDSRPIADFYYKTALKSLQKPFQVTVIAESGRRVYFPEHRFNCESCLLPIGTDSSSEDAKSIKCPHCGVMNDRTIEKPSTNVVDEVFKEYEPDPWEAHFSSFLNDTNDDTADPAQPHGPLDVDKDGWTNQEEHDWTSNAFNGFGLANRSKWADPNNFDSHPPITTKLLNVRVRKIPRNVRFMAKMVGVGGKVKFQLKVRSDGLEESKFKMLGDTVVVSNNEEWTLSRFTKKGLGPKGPIPAQLVLDRSLVKPKQGQQFPYDGKMWLFWQQNGVVNIRQHMQEKLLLPIGGRAASVTLFQLRFNLPAGKAGAKPVTYFLDLGAPFKILGKTYTIVEFDEVRNTFKILDTVTKKTFIVAPPPKRN